MRGLLVLGVGAVVATLSVAALADDKRDCLDNKDHELRITGCSAIIQRDAQDSIAYHNRGTAYYLKGDVDGAISDFNKAIELNPNYAPAYNGRGRAYASKGDFTHAVADVTKATELASKSTKLAPKSTARREASKSPPWKTKVSAKVAAAPAKQGVAAAPKQGVIVAKEMPQNTWPLWAREKFEN